MLNILKIDSLNACTWLRKSEVGSMAQEHVYPLEDLSLVPSTYVAAYNQLWLRGIQKPVLESKGTSIYVDSRGHTKVSVQRKRERTESGEEGLILMDESEGSGYYRTWRQRSLTLDSTLLTAE